MPPESENNSRLEIRHVLFIDIVGYSKLLNEEQKERLDQLTEIVLATAQVREATDEQLVRLPTGDGMALVFHRSAEEPARCALGIAEALRKHPEIPVRMGIHSGPVSAVTDVSGRTNIAGPHQHEQRVMLRRRRHILISQHVADDWPFAAMASRLRDLGECEVNTGPSLVILRERWATPGPAKFHRPRQAAAQKPARRSSVGGRRSRALRDSCGRAAIIHRASRGRGIPTNRSGRDVQCHGVRQRDFSTNGEEFSSSIHVCGPQVIGPPLVQFQGSSQQNSSRTLGAILLEARAERPTCASRWRGSNGRRANVVGDIRRKLKDISRAIGIAGAGEGDEGRTAGKKGGHA